MRPAHEGFTALASPSPGASIQPRAGSIAWFRRSRAGLFCRVPHLCPLLTDVGFREPCRKPPGAPHLPVVGRCGVPRTRLCTCIRPWLQPRRKDCVHEPAFQPRRSKRVLRSGTRVEAPGFNPASRRPQQFGLQPRPIHPPGSRPPSTAPHPPRHNPRPLCIRARLKQRLKMHKLLILEWPK